MTPQTKADPIPRELVGDNTPSVRPGDDPAIYGTAVLSPLDAVEVRSFQTFRLTYTVGRLGLDDTGAIRVSFRTVTDVGKFQHHDPKAANYVSARTSGQGRIVLRIGSDGTRPWQTTVTAQLKGGYLNPGDTIELTFGDTAQGGPGQLMQTFAEPGYEFRVAADVQATNNFQLLDQIAIPVVAGPAAKWVAVLPTLRRPGEPFALGLKAEDAHGNPTTQAGGRVRFEAATPIAGLPRDFDYDASDRAMLFEGLSVSDPCTIRIRVFVDDREVCEAGPLVIEDAPIAHFWGDLHGQSGETVGVNRIENYMDFARNKAFLDVMSHQGNDFQINAAFWARLNEVTAEWNEPGRFTTLPGYEWSGNTAVGGDHNVFFAEEGRQIVRCSHAILEDRSEMGTDAHTLTDLFAAMRGTDTVIYAHVGGRYCNLAYDHDPVLETAVEIHSDWGTFEWVVTDSFELGRRVGIVANSDGHKGRPGASYPGASDFGAYGGLTCFLTDRNDRASIMEAQRRRHHYATTGCRMFIDLRATLPEGSVVFDRNPDAVPASPSRKTTTAIMGDIVKVAGDAVDIDLRIAAHTGIERLELRRGAEVLETLRPYADADLGNRLRVLWSGAEYRGRGRNTRWSGRIDVRGAEILAITPINNWNPEQPLRQVSSTSVIFDSITTGNFLGVDLVVSKLDGATMSVLSNHGALETRLADVGIDPMGLDAGGLARRLSVQQLPGTPLAREMTVQRHIVLSEEGDTPIWLCVTTEDGFQAWSSPIYAYRG